MSLNWKIELKDSKKTSFSGKVHLPELGPYHTWLWTLNFDWSIFIPI